MKQSAPSASGPKPFFLFSNLYTINETLWNRFLFYFSFLCNLLASPTAHYMNIIFKQNFNERDKIFSSARNGKNYVIIHIAWANKNKSELTRILSRLLSQWMNKQPNGLHIFIMVDVCPLLIVPHLDRFSLPLSSAIKCGEHRTSVPERKKKKTSSSYRVNYSKQFHLSLFARHKSINNSFETFPNNFRIFWIYLWGTLTSSTKFESQRISWSNVTEATAFDLMCSAAVYYLFLPIYLLRRTLFLLF